MRWEAVLPLRAEHTLTDEAAAGLASMLPGVPVFIGYPEGEERPRVPVGRVESAALRDTDPPTVVVYLEVELPDAVRSLLGTGELGVGLDATIQTPGGPSERDLLIKGVKKLDGLAIVQTHGERRDPPTETVTLTAAPGIRMRVVKQAVVEHAGTAELVVLVAGRTLTLGERYRVDAQAARDGAFDHLGDVEVT